MKSQKLRWILWASLLAIVGILALIDQESHSDNLVEVAERPTREAVRAAAVSDNSALQWRYLEARTQASAVEVDLFSSRQLTATKLASTYVQPPEIMFEPTAPQAPFQYLGRLDVEPGKALIFLTDGKRVYSLMPGEEINNTWRLDRDEPQALYFTYLPMDIQQMISKSTKAIADEISQGVSG
jgi:hypothetical protein